ncbi:MAG: hypothetical protein ACREJC_15250 [Tepidisphaeraceae bacterium]
MTLLIALVMVAGQPSTNPIRRFELPSWRKDVHTRQQLADACGQFLRDPIEKDVEFCLVPRSAKSGPRSGIMISGDGGRTWRVLSNFLDFQTLFIHPVTGDLFAGIEVHHFDVEPKSREIRVWLDWRAVWMRGGKRWIDISPDGNGFMGPPSFGVAGGDSGQIVIHGNRDSAIDFTSLDFEYRLWRMDSPILLPVD